MTTTPNAVIGGAVEAAVVFCAVVGFFALMSVFGLFPQETVPLLLAVLGAFGCYLYGRFAARATPAVKVRVTVMPKAGVLDPQGKAIGHALGSARLRRRRRGARRQGDRAGARRDRPAGAPGPPPRTWPAGCSPTR